MKKLCEEWFYYDETSPSGIRWKKTVYAGKNHNIVRANVGDVAGSKNNNGWTVVIKRKFIKVHHVILYLHGELEINLVDHKDGNPFNNKLDNLRCVSIKLNARNCKKSSLNTSGTAGVQKSKNGYWKSTWYFQRELNVKYFSIKKLGSELAELCAVEHRDKMIRLLNILGYGYTDRHGK